MALDTYSYDTICPVSDKCQLHLSTLNYAIFLKIITGVSVMAGVRDS